MASVLVASKRTPLAKPQLTALLAPPSSFLLTSATDLPCDVLFLVCLSVSAV